MIGSLYSGISGLNANATALSVIGDNIANVNTTAFKSNTMLFSNVLSQSLTGSSGNNIGRGVQVWGMNAVWSQGISENTNNSTDLAVNGKGFFIVADEDSTTSYTRAGAFSFDKDGNLVNSDDLIVQGYEIDQATGSLGAINDINVASSSSPPSATTQMNIILNLDADIDESRLTVNSSNADSDVTLYASTAGSAGNNISIAFVDPAANSAALSVNVVGNAVTVNLATDAAGAITSTALQVSNAINAATNLVVANYQGAGTGIVEPQAAVTNLTGGADPDDYSTTLTVFDSIGTAINLTANFEFDQPGSWNWSISTSDGICTSSGTLAFNAAGIFDPTNSNPSNADPTIQITDLPNGSNDLIIQWEMLNNGSLTNFGGESTTTFQGQDGYTSGTLQNISVKEDGMVMGVYSNGQLTSLYQLAMADFPSYWGLNAIGDNRYQESRASGQAIIGIPGSASLGLITPSALEMSNVDLATEFVKMITTQRAFQSNARVITTSDEVLQELMSLKR